MQFTPVLNEPAALPLVGENIRFSEILSALTFALDLTEGALPGHNLRSCLLGMRLADAIGIPPQHRASLFYALQLKDVGCSSNSARMSALIGGDDRLFKSVVKLQDWTHPKRLSPRVTRMLWEQVLPGGRISERLQRTLKLAASQHTQNRAMIELRCERGANIARQLVMGNTVADAILHLDEHWDGSGYPDQLRGHAIPLLSRICSVAQNLDVFACAYGPAKALRIVRSRRKKWFDPEIVAAAEALASEHQLWTSCLPTDNVEHTRRAVLDLDPGLRSELSSERLDLICEVFADVVDTKSPFTFHHSVGVAEVAEAVADQLGFGIDRRKVVRRAGLLHDIGKLGVPNSILDKAGKLNADEWSTVRHHPTLSGAILRRVPALRGVAMLAEEHHERLDGSGYPRRLTARDISLESRVIALADNYAAMVERRPYRDPIDPRQAIETLSHEVGTKLDPTCFEALEAVARKWPDGLPASQRGAHQPRRACLRFLQRRLKNIEHAFT